MKNSTRAIGRRGETRAADFLIEQGFCIIARNYQAGRLGEMDLIAAKNDLLIFVEVKSRYCDRFGGPLHAITESKKRRLRLIAGHFLASDPYYYRSQITCRFDLIAVENNTIAWISDIIR